MAVETNELSAKSGGVTISNLPDLIRPAQLASALGISKTTLFRWSKAGNGPKRIAVAGTVFYAREDIIGWLAAHKRSGM